MTHETDGRTAPAVEILVVDDTPGNLHLLAKLLVSAGYEVRPTGKPEVALASALEAPPDLVLLDVRMPGLDGFELCRRLKADSRTAGVPVIFMSAAHDEADRVKGFDAGAVDFVTVPFEGRVVLARVATHIRLARALRELETERKLLERRVQERTAKLQESEFLARTGEERARATFEQAAVGMAYVALDGRFLRINRKFCEIVGYPELEMLERRFLEITHPDDVGADAELLRRMACGEVESDSREKRYVRKDGTWVWVERTVAVVRTEAGTPPWLITVVQDISARKQAERAVLEYQGRLREMAAQLSRAEERERRNIAAELHDHVGQSLSAMRALLAAARKATAGERMDAALDEVSNSLRQAIRATRDIMSSLSPPALTELGLSAAISEWLRENVANRGGLQVDFGDDGRPKPLGPDASAILFRAVRELVTNVVRHARASRVRVTLRREEHAIELIVEDDGIGLPAGRPPRRAAGEGGFGLFSIEERMSDIGGSLALASGAGHGVRATLT
ncbi:MAG: PAS domain S-box protein, partial [Acidobacteria bacterium]